MEDEEQSMIETDLQNKLKGVFDQLPNDISVYLFAEEGDSDIFSKAARDVVRSFSQISDRIKFKEYNLKHKLTKKWDIYRSPTILFDPDHYPIRWLGAPIGEEGRTFMEALILIGLRESKLSEESRRILKKIDNLRNIKIFVSPSCPYCPQQAVNGIKVVVENPELFSLEIIDIQCNPDLADRYSAQSVPQTFANEVLIAMGAQSEELFAASLEKMEQQTIFIPESDAKLIEADLLIVGGGPAGLTAGIYAVRSGLKTVILERGALGGQVSTTPVVENYPGFTSVGGKTLVDILVSHALEYAKIFQGEEALDIQIGDPIEVVTSRRRFQIKAVLLATGANHRHLGVPGEQRLSGRGVSYCSTCDGPLFKGKKVVIAGGGDSAVTEALHLFHMGVNVTIIHRSDSLRAQEHLTKNLHANNIPILFNTEIREIRGQEKVQEIVLYNNKTGETTTFKTDGVFVAIGYDPEVALARKLGAELTPDGFIKHDSHHRTNIPGIYSAGDVEGGFKQIVTAAGQGTEASISIFEDLMNPYWKRERAVAAS